MPLGSETLIGGAIVGGIGSLLVAILNRRTNNLEDEKQDKSVCDVLHTGTDKRLDTIQSSINHLIERVDRVLNGEKN